MVGKLHDGVSVCCRFFPSSFFPTFFSRSLTDNVSCKHLDGVFLSNFLEESSCFIFFFFPPLHFPAPYKKKKQFLFFVGTISFFFGTISYQFFPSHTHTYSLSLSLIYIYIY